MARVPCEVEYTELEGDYGMVAGVVVTCTKCGEEAESFGQTDASVRRCFALLHEQCNEDNYYVAEEDC